MDLMTDDKWSPVYGKRGGRKNENDTINRRAIGCVSLVIYVVHGLGIPHRF